MSHHYHPSKEKLDPKLQDRIERSQKRDYRIEHAFRRILHFVELLIAD